MTQPTTDERKTIRYSYADGATYSLMVGFGETYLPAFALVIGMGQVAAGLLSSIPVLIGGLLQLFAPRGVQWSGSYRRWVVLCASAQALSYLPLAVAAMTGTITPVALFGVAALYWGAGMAANPAWNNWIDAVIPKSVLTDFLAKRSRITQVAAFAAFVAGGMLLHHGESKGRVLFAFALLFCLAGASRFASVVSLRLQGDAPAPAPEAAATMRQVARRFLDPTSSRFLLFLLGSQVAVHIASPFFSPYMLAHKQFSYWEYATFVSAAYVSKIAFYPWIARIVKRYGAYRTLWVSAIFAAPPPLFWLWTPDVVSLCLLQVLAGFIWGCFELSSMLLVFHRIRPSERMRILTFYNLLNAVAVVGGSLIGAAVLASFPLADSYRYIFVASAVARILSLGALARTSTITVRFRRLYTRTVGLRPGTGALEQPILIELRAAEERDNAEGCQSPSVRP